MSKVKAKPKKTPVCKNTSCRAPILTFKSRSYCPQCELGHTYFETYWKALLNNELTKPELTKLHNYLLNNFLSVVSNGQWSRIDDGVKMNGLFQQILTYTNKPN